MSVQASAWAWSLHDLPTHLKLTLLAIADSCNAEGYGYPGQQRLAEQLGCQERQVRYNIAALVKRNLLHVIVRPGKGEGRHSNGYQLHLHQTQATGNALPQATGNEAPEATGNPTSGNRQSSVGQPAIAIACEPLEEPSEEPSDTSSALRARRAGGDNPATSSFDRFWEAWPAGQRKRGRKAALATWKTHHLEDQAGMIIADVLNRARHDEQWLRGFAPMPQTYLRGARWEDELAAPVEQRHPSSTMKGLLALEALKCQYRKTGSRKPSSTDSSDSP